jgi:hypothetical protein
MANAVCSAKAGGLEFAATRYRNGLAVQQDGISVTTDVDEIRGIGDIRGQTRRINTYNSSKKGKWFRQTTVSLHHKTIICKKTAPL